MRLTLSYQRESDTLTTLSHTLATLRTQNKSQTQQISTLSEEKSRLDRQVALSSAQERSLRSSLKGSESRNRTLKEEIGRLKVAVNQVRAQCATDVRRRDAEIARMKRHLDGKRGRDMASSSQAGVVVVNALPPRRNVGRQRTSDVDDPGRSSQSSLPQATAEHLTRLSQRLSHENDELLSLVRATLSTMRSLQGLPEDHKGEADAVHGDAYGSGDEFLCGDPSCDVLAADMGDVLEHLRELLTNPSFVPLEEVVSRDEEIERLREGWEMMAVRWKEAVTLMDGWKRRMVDEGDTINLEDLKHGLKLGSGIPTAQESRLSPMKPTDAAGSADTHGAVGSLHGSPAQVNSTDAEIDRSTIKTSNDSHRSALKETDSNAARRAPARHVSEASDEEKDPLMALEDELSALEVSGTKSGAVGVLPNHTRSRVPVKVSGNPMVTRQKLM